MLGCAGGPDWTATVTPPVRRWEIAVKISLKSAGLLLSPAVGGVDWSLTRLITVTVTPSVASWEIAVTTSARPVSLNKPAEIAVSLPPGLSPRQTVLPQSPEIFPVLVLL